jgi:sulfur carrier protein
MITVNGTPEKNIEGLSLTAYLEQENYQITRIAVERNGEILPKSQYAETILKDGDTLEIVSFVGGG